MNPGNFIKVPPCSLLTNNLVVICTKLGSLVPNLPIFNRYYFSCMGFPHVSEVKNRPAMQETQVQSLDWEDPLEKGMATHSSVPARKIS